MGPTSAARLGGAVPQPAEQVGEFRVQVGDAQVDHGVLARPDAELLDLRFEWVMPGHGRIHQASATEMHGHLRRCVEWMKG